MKSNPSSKSLFHVVKIGGKLIDDEKALHAFAALPSPKILVHGGGKQATELSHRLGQETRMVDGRRITSAENLGTIVMTYAGSLNKGLVARLQALGCPALGLSGADGDVIRAAKRPVGTIDYGFAGDVQRVDAQLLRLLGTNGYVPVLCSVTHDGAGQLLNTNADTIATETAIALAASGAAVELTYVFDKPGLLLNAEDDASVLSTVDSDRYADLKSAGAIHTGMLPKLDNAFRALAAGVGAIRLCNAVGIDDETAGTRLVISQKHPA